MSVFIALGLISSVPCHAIGWYELCWNDQFLCRVGHETL